MSQEPDKVDHHPESEPVAPEPTAVVQPAKTTIPPYVGVGLLIAALLVILMMINLRNRRNSAAERHDAPEVTAMSAELAATRSELNRKRMEMGLRPIENGGESIDDVAKRLSNDADTIVGLVHSFQRMLAEKDLELDGKGEELLRSEQIRKSLAAESSRLQGELQKERLNGADGDLAKRDLARANDQLDRLAAKLAAAEKDLKAAAGSRSSDDYADLQRRYEETRRSSDFFEKRVKELESELGRLRIFAKSESELFPAAVELFRTLRNLEGKRDSDNMTAYSDIGAKLGARVLKTLDFPTGSATMTEADQAEVPSLVAQGEDGDLILVVGYASTTGNVESNRVLSSDRATAVAQAISEIKRPGQMVQAVYIGQTNRFSSAAPERNQICEVWHIKKK
jgi:outer membrane protein OmpA-like peptidoglycan-associated protein